MIAADTNVLVRFLTGDDPAQEATARSLFMDESVWIAKTVLLETAWVLRSLYRFEDAAVLQALTKLLGLKSVQVEDEPAVAAALALAANGLELADAIHLASRPRDTQFVTFDKSFVKRARHLGVRAISTPGAKS
jgi:predicted nucleic-acid-binding protein